MDLQSSHDQQRPSHRSRLPSSASRSPETLAGTRIQIPDVVLPPVRTRKRRTAPSSAISHNPRYIPVARTSYTHSNPNHNRAPAGSYRSTLPGRPTNSHRFTNSYFAPPLTETPTSNPTEESSDTSSSGVSDDDEYSQSITQEELAKKKDRIHSIFQASDNRYAQRAEDSANRTWCKTVAREVILQRVKDFHEAMHDDDTTEKAHCRVCYQQKSPAELTSHPWNDIHPLYEAVADQISVQGQNHFTCGQCFPSNNNAKIPICEHCLYSLQHRILPYHCRVNNLAIGCTHRYPDELKNLSPLEERLLGIYQPCGWISKFEISLDKATDGRYRKNVRGHITAFPNDVNGIASNVLPHPLVEEVERLHVCFVGPRKPLPSDLAFVLTVRPAKLKRALVWLKANNHFYKSISIDEDRLREWGNSTPHSDVPRVLFESLVHYELSPEDEIRTGQYVRPEERGQPPEQEYSAEEVLARLQDRGATSDTREADVDRMEAEGRSRVGDRRGEDQFLEDIDPDLINEGISQLTVSGLLDVDVTAEHSLKDRLELIRNACVDSSGRWRGRKPNHMDPGATLQQNNNNAFIINRWGEEFADSNDPHYFPKLYPCLFPWGFGGPKALDIGQDIAVDTAHPGTGYSTARTRSNFVLRVWARCMLNRHGGLFATHATFPFLIFNMLIRSDNRRVSYLRMERRSFQRIEEIVWTLTIDELHKAETEYRETRTSTNERVAFLLRELSAFGEKKHMSNEERLRSRRQIMSLCLKYGMPCIWYTINPNDLSNEVVFKLVAHRLHDGALADELRNRFQNSADRIPYLVRDPVSSAKFFHRELELFCQHLVAVGQQSVFGKVSCYYGCVETNERGALHLHGFIWLDANINIPNLFSDVTAPENQGYDQQICDYIDSVFSECCDELQATQYHSGDNVYKNIVHLLSDLRRFDEVFDDEANWVAQRCQKHNCGATCTKYSYKNPDKKRGPPCRFRAPWALREKTRFTEDGNLEIHRNHHRVNRYCPALAVGMRHNTDTTFLMTSSAGLSMVYYGTNYGTKLSTPLWKRVSLLTSVLQNSNWREDDGPSDIGNGPATEATARRNNKSRQFLGRAANRIFTDRELSAVEVCANLLGLPNQYASETNWQPFHVNSLYWTIFRNWPWLKQAAGDTVRAHETPEVLSMTSGGTFLPHLDAYPRRGPLLRNVCFYDYLCTVRLKRCLKPDCIRDASHVQLHPISSSVEKWIQVTLSGPDQRVPVFAGHLSNDLYSNDPGFFHRTAVVLLGLFVPWEKFLTSTCESPTALWSCLKDSLSPRLLRIVDNIRLLHKSAEDARRDAKLWASRSEGEHQQEYESPDLEPPFTTYDTSDDTLLDIFHLGLSKAANAISLIGKSTHLDSFLHDLTERLSRDDNASADGQEITLDIRSTEANLTSEEIDSALGAQTSLQKYRMTQIEGDSQEDTSTFGNPETEFSTGGTYTSFSALPPHTYVGIDSTTTYASAGQIIAKSRSLNKNQMIALTEVCNAIDTRIKHPAHQHLQYIGGEGGTGKSWLIESLREVFRAKQTENKIVITAMSGAAAAGINGTTIHTAAGLRTYANETIPDKGDSNLDKTKQQWRRRMVLVIDEVSMMGLRTLYDLDARLGLLLGNTEKFFGGFPIVVFCGDFLQFTPVLQKSLLSDPDTAAYTGRNQAAARYKASRAAEIWQAITSVVLLDEQKRAQNDPDLRGILGRLRAGTQTKEDAAKIKACFDGDRCLDFSGSTRAITPLNRHRWDLNLHAALSFAKEHKKKLSIYLSGHHWLDRMPGESERAAAMTAGDNTDMPIPGLFPFVQGMPIIVNKNAYLALKVVNGSEFTAVGVVHSPGLKEVIVNDNISIFLGPPSGIILKSDKTQDLAIPSIPQGTILLPSITKALPETAKWVVMLCPHLRTKNFRLGIKREGLPCTPGWALTDYKCQGRTMDELLLGLYGFSTGTIAHGSERCSAISMYVQLSRARSLENVRLLRDLDVEAFLSTRMPTELVEGMARLQRLSDKTVAKYTTL